MTSLSSLLGMSRDVLRQRLEEYSMSQYVQDCTPITIEPERVLLFKIAGKQPRNPPDSVIWFHGTRVMRKTNFAEGILPLNLILKRIEADLSALAISNNLVTDKKGHSLHTTNAAHRQEIYDLKTGSTDLRGPFAFLTRDALVNPDSTDHYLDAPEIIEDIAISQYGHNADAILNLFRERTKPCIVHFRDRTPRNDVVEVALTYLYNVVHDKKPFGRHHTCFDGGGKSISFDAITRVEYLE